MTGPDITKRLRETAGDLDSLAFRSAAATMREAADVIDKMREAAGEIEQRRADTEAYEWWKSQQ